MSFVFLTDECIEHLGLDSFDKHPKSWQRGEAVIDNSGLVLGATGWPRR